MASQPPTPDSPTPVDVPVDDPVPTPADPMPVRPSDPVTAGGDPMLDAPPAGTDPLHEGP